jgi:hypothetical protein
MLGLEKARDQHSINPEPSAEKQGGTSPNRTSLTDHARRVPSPSFVAKPTLSYNLPNAARVALDTVFGAPTRHMHRYLLSC